MTQKELLTAIEALPKELQFALASSVLNRLALEGPSPISEQLKSELEKRVESQSGSTRFCSSNGSIVERSTTSGDLTRFYDKSGRSIGTSRTSGTSTRFYSASGAYQGKAEKANSGTTRFYDSSGRSLGTKRR